MKLSKLKLWNYRCFGSEEQVILIDQLTTFIGNNSAGKTAALSALNCMFSENSNDRILHRSDFHLPKDILPDEMEQQSLYIEAVFEFEELQSGSNGGEFDEMQRKLSAVVNVVKKNIQQKLDTEQWHSTLNSIIDFFGIGNIKAKFPAYKQGTYFMNVINQFESLFFEEYVAAHGVWNLAIENFRGDHSVPIMTIHKSKGLEYNAVYFIGLEDSAFWNFRNQPDEDRCTFFVALSRAKASVTFTFCKKRTGMKCPMQRHNAINEFFDLLQRPGIAEVKRFQNR